MLRLLAFIFVVASVSIPLMACLVSLVLLVVMGDNTNRIGAGVTLWLFAFSSAVGYLMITSDDPTDPL